MGRLGGRAGVELEAEIPVEAQGDALGRLGAVPHPPEDPHRGGQVRGIGRLEGVPEVVEDEALIRRTDDGERPRDEVLVPAHEGPEGDLIAPKGHEVTLEASMDRQVRPGVRRRGAPSPTAGGDEGEGPNGRRRDLAMGSAVRGLPWRCHDLLRPRATGSAAPGAP